MHDQASKTVGSGQPGLHGKRYFEGTHRIRTPAETWAWIADVLPKVGITRVADVTGLDCLGIPVFQAVRPGGLNLSVSQGKAATPEAARVSGTMEAIELWHAESLGHLPQVTMPLRQMEVGNAIPTASLKLRSDTWKLDALPIPWIEATSPVRDRTAFLPRGMLELDFRVSPLLRPNLFHLTSNGLASGNCFEEALLHSLCELVERQGLFLAFEDPSRRRPIDLDSVEDPGLRSLMDRVHGAGMKMAAFDLTFELGLPIILVDLVARDLPHIWRGAGCHLSPTVAFSRALTEAAQARLTYISGARDDIIRFPKDMDPESRFETFPDPGPGAPFDGIDDLATASVDGDLGRVLERLDAHGLEPFYVDLTRDDINVPVTTCFIPGFREAPHA
ncbi:MAG: YcaO-like family protein [Acidobacteriota bacterium]